MSTMNKHVYLSTDITYTLPFSQRGPEYTSVFLHSSTLSSQELCRKEGREKKLYRLRLSVQLT